MRRQQLSLRDPKGFPSLLLPAVLLCFLAMQSVDALHPVSNKPPKLDDYREQMREEAQRQANDKYEAAALSKVTQGTCYSPFHNPEYPLNGKPGNVGKLGEAMYNDFAIMKNFFSVVRTYYTSYYGVPVTPAAAANGVKLYLGVYMTNEAWYKNQVDDAIAAVKNYPDTIAAILVGNENVAPAGPYSANEVSDRITEIRARLKAETGRVVPVGTVQRATEWIELGDRAAIAALAANCDIIGVNIYPFFDANYNSQYPLAILNGIWDKMMDLYPPAKVRLTETGFPTGGTPPEYASKNVPSLANSRNFYNAYINWNPSRGGGEAFWFMFYDRAPDDSSMGVDLETYFGLYTWNRASKAADYPALATALGQAYSPPAVSTVVVTTSAPVTAAPTTNAPAPTTSSPVIPTLPSTVCRVKKQYIP